MTGCSTGSPSRYMTLPRIDIHTSAFTILRRVSVIPEASCPTGGCDITGARITLLLLRYFHSVNYYILDNQEEIPFSVLRSRKLFHITFVACDNLLSAYFVRIIKLATRQVVMMHSSLLVSFKIT